jgi:tRNA(Arg) A34 adenosine deaminase TadA
MTREVKFMVEAIALSQQAIDRKEGGPFGCVIVKDDVIIGRGNNKVLMTNDPTAHAEIVAIREACKTLNNFHLDGCEVYTSCEPCPMCLSAIYWSRAKAIYFANTRKDAAAIGFDDDMHYDEMTLDHRVRKVTCTNILRSEAQKVFEDFKNDPSKNLY